MNKQDTFLIVGPGIISGPWAAEDYREGLRFIEDVQEARGFPTHTLGDWCIDWHRDDFADAREALRVHAGITVS